MNTEQELINAVRNLIEFKIVWGSCTPFQLRFLSYLQEIIKSGVVISGDKLKILNTLVNKLRNESLYIPLTRYNENLLNTYYTTSRYSYINLSPILLENKEVLLEAYEEVTLTTEMFLHTVEKNYFDPEGDPVYQLKILSLPQKGELLLKGSSCYVGQEILFTDIGEGNFIFKSDSNTEEGIISFDFTISDLGSKKYLK